MIVIEEIKVCKYLVNIILKKNVKKKIWKESIYNI